MTSVENEKRFGTELRPCVTLTAEDYGRLTTLARAAEGRMPDAASALGDELERAQVLVEEGRANSIVRMGSEVEFRDDSSGKVQTVTLVYPDDADIAQGRVSILTPVGTALIGLPAGASITWRTRTGQLKRLTVLQVREPLAR